MLQLLKKHVKVSLIVIAIVMVVLLWIPLLWHRELQFDKVKFATEYYKTLVDTGKVLLGFWLANIFLKKMRKDEFLHHYQQQWRDEVKILLEAITSLSTVSDEPSKTVVDDWIDKIKVGRIKLDYLADVTSNRLSEYDLGTFGSMVHVYEHELCEHILKILRAFEKGEILPKKPLSQEIKQSVNALMEQLSSSFKESI